MAKILVLGASGQVGFELCRTATLIGDVLGLTRKDADLSNPDTLRRAIELDRPDFVINAAADTAVDAAEANLEKSRAANSFAPKVVAESCREIGARMIHFSTDYVFDGTKGRPYVEGDETNPVNAYGRSKLEGEEAVLAADPRHLVLRLSWVYSWRAKNFALTMLRLAKEGKPIRVVADQTGSPSYAPHIAQAVAYMVDLLSASPNDPGGLYHLTSPGHTTWHGFATTLLDLAMDGRAPHIEPIPTSAFPTPAKRPAYSVLNSDKAFERFGVRLPNWEKGVQDWAQRVKTP